MSTGNQPNEPVYQVGDRVIVNLEGYHAWYEDHHPGWAWLVTGTVATVTACTEDRVYCEFDNSIVGAVPPRFVRGVVG